MLFFRRRLRLTLLLVVIITAAGLLTSLSLLPWNNLQLNKYADIYKAKPRNEILPSTPSDPPGNESDRTCSKQISLLLPQIRWRDNGALKRRLVKSNEGDVDRYVLSCPKYRCNLTVGVTIDNKEFLNKSDGVVINVEPNAFNLHSGVERIKAILRKDVTWFFISLESPQLYARLDPEIPKLSVHYSITYHSLSTLPHPYGSFVTANPMDTKPQKNWASGKTHLIAWMSSKCSHTYWPRFEFVKDLLKYVPIDMYGSCGNLTCRPAMSPQCDNLLIKYKFYLALENTECDEYITEKFWEKALNHETVPVVYGGRRSAYEKVAPPNSFIHVGDFENLQELANYLLELDKDDEKYNQYLQWRLKGHIVYEFYWMDPDLFCDTIPLITSKHKKPKRRVADLPFSTCCRGNIDGRHFGSYRDWSPWK